MLIFEKLVVKCCHVVQQNWSRYRDTGVTNPALVAVTIVTIAPTGWFHIAKPLGPIISEL